MAEPVPYIPGLHPKNPGPLARYLPPLPDNVIAKYLKSYLSANSLIVDPFGTLPKLAIEAAQAGYRIIVTANNPIARFLLEMQANPPARNELQIALADLAATRSGNESLENQIKKLYLSQCNLCGHEIQVKAFIWDRDLNLPTAKQYTCERCGNEEIQPTTEWDTNRALEFTTDKLHRSRALERVAAYDDPDRRHVEEAIETYLPRALYALFTIINRLDRMALPKDRRRQIELLLLSAFDAANSLWSYPGGRTHPRLLSLSPRFWENNVWLALENAINECVPEGVDKKPVNVSVFPTLPPPDGGITIFEGRFKELVGSLKDMDIRGGIGAFPRPNQAYWTLSALWSGWLWGKTAVRPFKSVLRRRRYDWNWHTTALSSIFENLYQVVKPGTPFLGLVAEAEPGFLSAVLISTEINGFDLKNYAFRADSSLAQLTWQRATRDQPASSHSTQEFRAIASQAAIDYLSKKAEPCTYLQLHTAALIRLAEKTHFHLSLESGTPQVLAPAEVTSQITGVFEQAFTYRAGLVRYGGSEKSLDVGQWGLRQGIDTTGENKIPLSDRVEMELVRYLLKNPGQSLLTIDSELCKAHPGLLTPAGELVDICLESYAEESPKNSDQWYVRRYDLPQSRRMALESIHQSLTKLAEKLNYRSEGERPLIWLDENGKVVYVFYILAAATFGEIVISNPYPPELSVIVLPGSRANLALYKLKRNLYLQQLIAKGWRFVKFRHVYRLLENPLLDRANFPELISLDPLQDAKLQMRLL